MRKTAKKVCNDKSKPLKRKHTTTKSQRSPVKVAKAYADYIDEVEKSGILTRRFRNPFSDDDNSLKACLLRCRRSAVKEFRTCHKDLVYLFENIVEVENSIGEDINKISKQYRSYQTAWHGIFEQFNLQLAKIFQHASDSLVVSFDTKVKRIDKFTICLFGRTKAGKSTTMEALTEGDGATIGKGRQNTTLDAKEYIWRELLIVDTPGIDAMSKADNLETKALFYADQSDLVVFLLPHQIEEGDFDMFSRFYKQNKPILFLLNVKKEIGKKGSTEYNMFLKYSDDIFEKDKISGYKERIFDYMLSKLDVKKDLIPVIPVHSASAFMALSENSESAKNRLRVCSNFDLLEEKLSKEVREYGELYRIKNPHETVILFADIIASEFRLFQDHLQQKREVFEKNIIRFSEVKAEIIKKRNQIIENKIENYFDSKKESVPSLVENIFSEKDETKRKEIDERFISGKSVRRKVLAAHNEIRKIIVKEIKDFFNTFSEEIDDVNNVGSHLRMHSKNNLDIKGIEGAKSIGNIMGGLSVASSAVFGIGSMIVTTQVGIFGAAGTLFGIGSANIWNPVGWGLLAVSVTTAFASVILTKKHKENNIRAKLEAVNMYSVALSKQKNRIARQVKQWVDKILDDIEENHIGVMQQYVEFSEKYITECNDLFANLERISTKSKRQKFRSMLRSLQLADGFRLKSIADNKNGIVINISGIQISNKKTIESILSRVEEKQVTIIGE